MGVSRPNAEQQKRPRAETGSPHFRVAETLSRATVEGALQEIGTAKGSSEPPKIDLLVWHSPYFGRSSDFAALLSGLIDRETHLLVVEIGAREDGASITKYDPWSTLDDGIANTLSAGRDALEGIAPVEETVTTTALEAFIGVHYIHGSLMPETGCLVVEPPSSPCPTHTVRGRVLRIGPEGTYVDRADPSWTYDSQWLTHMRGHMICPAGNADSVFGSHKEDRVWDDSLTGKRSWKHGVRALTREEYPSVETLQGLLYRTGAVARGGTVVVSFDPFGGWLEACASLGLDGVFFVSDEPSTHIKDTAQEMWRDAATKVLPKDKKRGPVKNA